MARELVGPRRRVPGRRRGQRHERVVAAPGGLSEPMRFVDEYRDPAAARALVAQITELAGDDEFKFMEVCGGHTHTIYRHGIEHVLPPTVELVHGPGCPVCVIPMGRVDDAIAVAKRARRDLHLVRRHDAGARQPGQPARGQGPGGGHPVRLLAPRRPPDRHRQSRTARWCSSPSASRRPRRRPPSRCCEARASDVAQLHGVLQPRDDRPADQGHPRVPGPAPRRLPRARATSRRSSGSGPTGSSPPSTASPSSRPASSRSTSCRPSPCC